ncbi:hypothetical protein ACVWYU_005175 [Pseudomonas sp. TE12234]
MTESRESTATDPLINQAITDYQTAGYGYKQQLLDWKAPMEGTDQVSER